ncbi:lipase family protein [Methanococcus maripaludis]|uniref:Fungal lipase-type domain-containing protein n=1 Tax=Methanococcus maripaludis TaxID=39152 RepID=A0A7J9PTL3_METMI|nr:lipase family protein [Methanococcus maripaludis]MBA2868917.1 hypothetical protein [Methanococcus maripaludis]
MFEISSQYNPANTYFFAELCNLIYEDIDELSKKIAILKKNDPYLDFKVKDVFESRFMVLHNNESILLVFRGTANLKNSIIDVKIAKKSFEEGSGKVHLGFYQTIQSMKDHINIEVEKARTNDQKIYIMGHSLGGAQALLSAFLCSSLKDFVNITTFGQPRVGDKAFAEWSTERLRSKDENKSKYFRIVNKRDPVANLPYLGYYHCGEFYINCDEHKYYNIKSGEVTNNLKTNEQSVTSSQGPDVAFDFIELSKKIISNHYMDLYVENASRNRNYNPFLK